jgi:hypothetical protein
MLTRITDVDVGTYLLLTASGTAYRLEVRADGGTLTRYPREEPSSAGYERADLRQDGEPLPLLGIIQAEVGTPAVFLVDVRHDGIPTLRTTTPVLTIEIERDPAGAG